MNASIHICSDSSVLPFDNVYSEVLTHKKISHRNLIYPITKLWFMPQLRCSSSVDTQVQFYSDPHMIGGGWLRQDQITWKCKHFLSSSYQPTGVSYSHYTVDICFRHVITVLYLSFGWTVWFKNIQRILQDNNSDVQCAV